MADTQAIKDRVDIVQLLQEYLPLKKAGANWKANCPFHHEKSPSFMVHPEKQIWHCFGCGKGGDIFTFVQEMEGLEFIDALKLLADRAGVKIDTNVNNEIAKSQRNRIFEVNAKAAYFFHNLLLEMPASKMAREYLFDKRKLSEQTVKDWQVGFIPDQWELLTQYLLKKGFGIDDLIASGLVIKNEERKSFYDRFRGRIMFPIWDAHGNVVGFTGRILVEKENSGGKYVNTPQSPVYDKSRVLYGLNKAKHEIKAKDLVVIVEGQMDVIACHAAGMTNVVASSGTALTDEQVRLLKRYTANVAIAFDADAAGQNAAKRGIDVALAAGMNIKVIRIPEGAGKDADECLKKNPKVWFDAVANSQEIMKWYFDNILAGVNLNDFRAKQRVTDQLLTEIAKIPFKVESDAWMRKLSDIVGGDPAILAESMKKVHNNSNHTNYESKSEIIKPALVQLSRLNMLQENFFALVVRTPALFSSLHSLIRPEYFSNSIYASLYDFAEKHYNNSEVLNFANFSGANDTNVDVVGLLFMKAEKDFADMNKENSAAEAELILSEMSKLIGKEIREQLRRELRTAQEAGDAARENQILQQIMSLKN
ncbi:MAG: DNA primase [Patescibacteria group bacterium]